jgi:transcriptional regulator with XRE-family HTH domain
MNASKKVALSDISPAQCRAARGLLDWKMEILADHSGVNRRTLLRFERGQAPPRASTLSAIRTALESAGVEFIAENGGGAGVRLRAKG